MVAAGGGGAEWENAIGGNGGELEGGQSTSTNGAVPYPEKCDGPNQTSGKICTRYGDHGFSTPGTFGIAGTFVSSRNDWGGIGGGGYYGGTSFNFAYAGSGGSSFISGHDGCKAIRLTDDETIEHTNESFHYSGYVFRKTKMIGGNKTMTLPSGKEGIWDEDNGAFKITLISFNQITCRCSYHRLSLVLFVIFISYKH